MTLWTLWRPEIAKACDGSHHSIVSIEAQIASGRAFVLADDACCYVVELVDYPQERACQITWAAGTLPQIKANLPKVHAWAKAQGCSEMLVEGHAGWARALRDLEYKPWSVTLRRAL